MRISARLFGCLVLGILITFPAPAWSAEELLAYLVTDKVVYTSREPIIMTLKILNESENDVTLHFLTSQRYDFFIYDREKLIWKWSDNRFFLEVLGTETLEARTGVLVYQEIFRGELPPGSYLILGIVVAQNATIGNIFIIDVEPASSD